MKVARSVSEKLHRQECIADRREDQDTDGFYVAAR
jgi:hypothetical protein